jgi:hypothetical protein
MTQEEQIQQLLNYVGGDYLGMTGEDPGSGLIGYKGVQNPFDSKSRMAKITALAQDRTFDLTIVNATEKVQECYLIPSLLVGEGDNGHPISGKAVSGANLDFNSASGPDSATALRAFYRYIEKNPSLIVGLRIETSDKSQMSKTIIITSNINPYFAGYAKKKLNIQNYVDENVQQRDIATIDAMIPADDQSQVLIPLVPGTHTLTLFMGPNLNPAQVLREQAMNAIKG